MIAHNNNIFIYAKKSECFYMPYDDGIMKLGLHALCLITGLVLKRYCVFE